MRRGGRARPQLGDDHRAEDDHDAERLERREVLAERDPAERGRDDGAQQRQERHVGRGERTDAAKPERVSEGGSDDREVGVAGEVARRQRGRWRPFDGERDRRSDQASRYELPAGRRQQRRGRRPALAEHDPGGHHGRGAERGGDADSVQRRTAAEHEQAHAHDTGGAGDGDVGRDALTQEPPGKRRDQQRLHRDDRRGDATRKPICGDEQQREERADIQRAEHDRAPPPAAVGQASGQRDEHESGWESANHGSQQRASRREQLAGDQVRRAPDRGSQSGHCDDSLIS